MAITIIYDSLTGNTEQVASACVDECRELGVPVKLVKAQDVLKAAGDSAREKQAGFSEQLSQAPSKRLPAGGSYNAPVTHEPTQNQNLFEQLYVDDQIPDLLILASWVNRSTFSPTMMKLVEKLKSEMTDKEPIKTALVATAGWVKGDYPERIKSMMTRDVEGMSDVQGFFLCQGKMRESTLERYKRGDSQHATTPEMAQIKIKNWEEALSHPDTADLENAREFVKAQATGGLI